MKRDSKNVLLYIEPENIDEEIVIDKFSIKVFNAMSPIIFDNKKDRLGSIGIKNKKPVFTKGIYSMGHHTCICGANSTGYDILLDEESGLITNYLCLHYLVCHRSEVPKDELEKIRSLDTSITLNPQDREKFNVLAKIPIN